VTNAQSGLGSRIETGLMAILLLGIVVVSAAQIVLRNFFSYSLFWADDLVRIAVLWLAVIGAVAASREGRHIAIGIVPRYFPVPWHRPARIVSMAFATLVCVLLAWHMGRFVHDSYVYADRVLGNWPAWPFQIVMPIGFALMSYRFALRTIASVGKG